MLRGMRAVFLAIGILVLTGCARTPYVELRSGGAGIEVVDHVQHGQGSFHGFGGTPLYEQFWRPTDRDPRAALIVMHGLKDYSSRYESFAQGLVKHGFAVHAFDLRGHGRSAGNRVAVNDFEEYVIDIEAFQKRVEAREPGRPVFVFGHSMGGAIVATYMLERKPKVAGMILSGPALEVDVSGVTRFSTGIFAFFWPNLRVLSLDDEDFSRSPEIVRSMSSDPFIYEDAGPARTALELFGAISYIQDHMEEMSVPFLLLHGTEDKLTDPQGSQDLYRRAKSTDKTLKTYEGWYHDSLHEPEHAKVEKEVTAWLESRAPDKS